LLRVLEGTNTLAAFKNRISRDQVLQSREFNPKGVFDMPEVVLDNFSVFGILRMAEEEGLLRDKEGNDGYLYSLKQRPFSDWHRQQILEQIILNSKVHTICDIAFDVIEGDFLTTDLIQVAQQIPNAASEGKAVAPEIVEGLLRSRGYEKEFDEWIEIFERFRPIYEEVSRFEAQNPDAKIGGWGLFVRAVIDEKFEESSEYKLARKWNQAYGEVSPLLSAVEEYIKLSDYASSSTHSLRTPIYRLSANMINLTSDDYSDNTALNVYRITTQELGFVPTCSSLRQALEITNNPDVLALRHQIDAWLESLSHDSVDLTSKIQGEIKKASKSLAKANALQTASEYMGYISLPISIVSNFIPFVGAVGFGIDCVATIFEKYGKHIEEKVRWVSLGSRVPSA
jgi:hypothetical protein